MNEKQQVRLIVGVVASLIAISMVWMVAIAPLWNVWQREQLLYSC